MKIQHRKSLYRTSRLAVISSLALGIAGSAALADFSWSQFSGRSITVMMPEHPVTDGVRAVLDQFEADTGINVSLQTMAEDLYFDRMEVALRGAGGNSQMDEPLAQLSRFGRPRPAFRFRQGRDTGSGGCPGRLHEPKCGGMPQLVAHRAPSAHGWPCRPLRGGVRGGRICQNQWCQMVSRISCSTVRASTPKNRWQATLACPRTRTCRAP